MTPTPPLVYAGTKWGGPFFGPTLEKYIYINFPSPVLYNCCILRYTKYWHKKSCKMLKLKNEKRVEETFSQSLPPVL